MPTVAAIPRQWLLDLPERGQVDLEQHRHDHQPDQHSDRQIDLRDRRRAERMEQARHGLPERDADDDAERDPERQIALESAHGAALCRGRLPPRSWRGPRNPVPGRVHDRLAVLFRERAALRIGENIQHRFRTGGRASRPCRVTTIGRLMRMGCAIMASISASSVRGPDHRGPAHRKASPSGAANRAPANTPCAAISSTSSAREGGGFSEYFDDARFLAAVADQGEDVAATCRNRGCDRS